MRGLQKIDFEGHLNKDVAPEKLTNGDYSDARNVQFLTNNTESTGDHIPMLGNTPAFDLGSVSTQYKTYRLYTENVVAPEGFSILLFYNNGIQFGAPTATTATYAVHWSRNQPIVAQAAQILAAISVWDGTSNTVVTAGSTYIDITLNLITGYDYTISATTGQTPAVPMVFNTLYEAYDTTLSGELKTIGSYDLLGDLYVWSTTGGSLPLKSTLIVDSVALYAVGTRQLYRITFNGSTPHNLSIGQSVNLLGITGSAIDGTWIVSSSGFTPFTIVLEDYFSYTALPASPTIGHAPTTLVATLYSNSIGEIGVGQYTASTDSWLYTRLGRTKQWGFRTQKQPDTYCEQTAVKSSIYWTDDFNVPRVIYYIFEYDVNNNKQAFETDGIISTINPTGLYTYETILTESSLQLNENGSRITFVGQLQSGGQVVSGNWRYATRFLTESLTTTTISDVTNSINVYLADANGNPTLIIGDEPNTVTSKINRLEITGIQPGLFKYIELIGVNYVGDAVVGYVIKRELLTSTQTSITISHTGTETNVIDLDLGVLSQIFEQVATAKNIAVIDKRMILSNLTTRQKIDFTSWAQTIRHSVSRRNLTAVRSATDGTIIIGEYQIPENVNRYVGYMHNETYRFGVEVHIKNAGWTDAFHVQDIKINCDTTVARRISALPDFNLTNNTLGNADDIVFSAYVGFLVDATLLDYRVDGIRVRDLIDGIRFVRAEVIPTVLACGMIIPSVIGAVIDATYVYTYDDPGVLPYTYFGEFPFISGRAAATSNPLYDAVEFNGSRERRMAAFYSPDVQFGHTAISFLTGDVVSIFGNPFYINFQTYSGASYNPQFGQYSGRTSATGTVIIPLTVSPSSMVSMSYGQDINTFPSTRIYRKQAALYNSALGGGNYSVHYITQSLVLETSLVAGFDNPITVPAQEDRGFYYSQYIRASLDQYGDIENTRYITTGHFLEITNSTGTSTEQVFGGDTFTQLNFLRHRTYAQDGIQMSGFPAPSPPDTEGFGGGVSFYCQNRINSQMKQKSPSQVGNLYPGISTLAWLDSIANTDGNNGEAYQEGYTIRNEVQSTIAFNPNQADQSDQPARIRWSAIKSQGSASDQYRVFLALDFHDLDQSFGEIVHHANGNGELITWQQRAFMRQYFNTRGILEVKGITEILIGDGSVMSRDGVTVSRLGSKHKWAIIRGKSTGGNDTFYWLNTELKKALRFGYDGIVSIADIKGMQSFLANNLAWVDGFDTPAHGVGICGVWDDRFANVLWTVVGENPNANGTNDAIDNWSSALGYVSIGTKIFYPVDPFMGKQFTYKNINNSGNLNKQPDTSPTFWELIPNDGTYFNKYTLIFNEFKNAFICDATLTPKIYLKWTDTFLSPRPISPEYKIYQHNKGNYLTWYLYDGVSQTERGFIEGICNIVPEETKWAETIGVDSEVAPILIEFETKNQETFLTQSEFTSREDSFFSSIKNDSTTSGINSSNTTGLFGKYIKAKIFFEIGIYQKLSNFIIKFRISPRVKSK